MKIIKEFVEQFKEFTLTRILHGENTIVDALTVLASTYNPNLRRIIPIDLIEHPIILVPKKMKAMTRSQAAQGAKGDTKKAAERTIS